MPGRIGSLAAFAAALLARESAIVLLPLLVLVDLASRRRERTPSQGPWWVLVSKRYLPYVGVLVLYLILRVAVVGTATSPTALGQVSLPLRLATMLEVVVRYVALLVVPVNLHMERTVAPATSLLSPAVLGSAVLVAGAVALAVVLRSRAAEGEYRRALALDPRMSAAHNNLGNLYRSQRRPEDAMAAFRQALALNPADAAAHNNLGLALLDLGRPDDARAEFEAAIRINPDYAAAHSNLGNHHFRRGQLAAAAGEYRAAIRLDPGFAQAPNNLGSVYFNMGQLDLAEQQYRRALELNPGLDEVRRNLEVVRNARARATGAPVGTR